VIQKIESAPILFMTGGNDPTVHPWHSQELYDKAREKKALTVFHDNFHAEDLYISSRERFINTCNSWLSSLEINEDDKITEKVIAE